MERVLNAFFKIGLAVLAVVGIGCASIAYSSFDYTPPDLREVENELYLAEPFEEVWARLVREISKSFFVINNIDKESRIINLDFSLKNPQDYVDCGMTDRAFRQGEQNLSFHYLVAEPSAYKLAGPQLDFPNHGQVIQQVVRETSLKGRANIFLAPENGGTRITVNCRFVFAATTSGIATAYDGYGVEILSQQIEPSTSTVTFNSNAPGEEIWDGMKIECVSLGKLEKEILDMAAGRDG